MSKARKVKLDQYNVKTNKYTKFQSQHIKRRQRKVQKTIFKQRTITPVKVGQA